MVPGQGGDTPFAFSVIRNFKFLKAKRVAQTENAISLRPSFRIPLLYEPKIFGSGKKTLLFIAIAEPKNHHKWLHAIFLIFGFQENFTSGDGSKLRLKRSWWEGSVP